MIQNIRLSLLLAVCSSSFTLLHADSLNHAADDELALAAAQLAAQATAAETAPQPVGGAPAGISLAATLADNCSSAGAWGPIIRWTPHIPVSAANLPDGRILTFAANARTNFPGGSEFTYAATWNPATGSFEEFNNATHDMFCGGITSMPDGRVMVNGGRNETPYVSIFDWRTNTWTRVQNMTGGRWYNTSLSLPSGQVFTATGSGTGVNTTERWSSTAGWTQLTGIPWNTAATVGSDAGYMKHWHPFLSVAPDGRVLHYGPTDTMHWFNTSGTGSVLNTGTTVPGAHYPKEGCFAMFDEGKVLVAGGSANTNTNPSDSTTGTSTGLAYTVDMNGSTPVVTATASMAVARQFANAVVLPSCEVMVIGGNTSGLKFTDVGAVLPCEIWNPRTGTWRTLASISVPRTYHSTALLLPDGRVWSGGGGLGGGDHQDAQVFTPPCLFTASNTPATRPVLNTAPTRISLGTSFSVTGTAGLARFSFIRMAALTHSVNTDQRFLPLAFTETSAGNYQVRAHANANVMLPGYWMLFGVLPNGAYSVAKIILVDPNAGTNLSNPGNQLTAVNAAASLQLSATGPAGSTVSYSVTGLPPGLAISSSGLISGRPTTSGVYSVSAVATAGGSSANQAFTWTVTLTNTGTGSILREWWLGIAGDSIASLTSSTAYPNSPAGRDQPTAFETTTDWADNMGQRVRGFVTAPVTGQYQFWIASDDNGRLLLSTDGNPANARTIASVPTWTTSRAWTVFPEQASAMITLQAGQPYYIEALMKEGGGGDNLAVAWQIPGTSGPVVIAGQYLSPWTNNRAPSLTSLGNRTGVVGVSVSQPITASDPDGDALIYSATGLPTGLSINRDTGLITGTPSAGGSFSAVITVTDNRNPSVSINVAWSIAAQLALNPVAATPPAAIGAALSYTARSTGGVNVRYKWSWGDGTADTAFGSAATASHSFTAAGRYLITLTATDDTARVETYTFHQAIYATATTLRPTASSSIIFEDRATGANDRVWCVNGDNDSVTVFDAITRTRLAEIVVGTAPRTLALMPNGNVWVSNIESSSISIISGNTLAVVQTITLPRGARPFGIAVDPDGSDAWIACEGNGLLLRMNPASGAQLASFQAGIDARHVSVSADSARVFVTRFITPLLPGEATGTVTPTSSAGGEVLSILTATLTLERKTILQHSDRADTITTGRGIPNYLGPAILSPDGSAAWVPSKQDNIKRGMLRDGQQLTHDQTVRSIVSRIPLASNGAAPSTDNLATRVDLDNAGIASNAAFEPRGIYLFTALEGSREVGVVDVWNKREARRFTAGRAPQGIVTSPDGRTVYVQNFMDRSITVHDASALIDGRDTVPTLIETWACVRAERLSATVLLGKQLFYDSADRRLAFQGYISCASCHNDGDQDGRVWDFTGVGEGLRNTITLRGHGGMAQGPLHWSGNFDEVQDFENQLRNLSQGTGLIASGSAHPPFGTPNAGRSTDLDALAAYVSSLGRSGASPYRSSDGSLTDSARAGRLAFNSFSCVSCHSGTQFTNPGNALSNVGTIKPSSGQRLGAVLTGIDSPTLRGLWNTAPYLHDGSASTLEASILAHTNTPRPTAGSQAMTDLVNYLLQIDDSELTPAPHDFPVTLTAPATVTVGTSFQVQGSFPFTSVTGLEAADFTVTNGRITSVINQSNTGTFFVTVAPTTVGPLTVQLRAGTVTRTGGNNAASNVTTTQVAAAPTATLTGPSSTTGVITTRDFTAALSLSPAATTAPQNSDFTTTNCSVLGLSGSGSTWTLSLRATAAGSLTLRYVTPSVSSNTLALTFAPPYPITYSAWQTQVLPGHSANANMLSDTDQDGLTDLYEYALGTLSGTGVQITEGLRIETNASGQLMASVICPIGPTDVSFGLEQSGDLVSWLAPSYVATTTDVGNGTQRITWADPNGTFLRLRVTHSSGQSSTGRIVSRQALTLNAGTQTLGVSVLRAPVFSGVVSSVSAGNSLILSDHARLAQTISSGTRYYLEVSGGTHTGHRFDIQSFSTTGITLDLGSVHNTRATAPATLVGSNIIIRPHLSIGSIFDPSLFFGSNSPASADQIITFRNGAYTTYWLANITTPTPRRHWVRTSDATLADSSGTVLPPGTGVFIKIGSGTRNWKLSGQVRRNNFVQPLSTAHNFVCAPWPLAQSPTTLGLTRSGIGTGGRSMTTSDRLVVWSGDTPGGPQGYATYWLLDLNNGTRHWISGADTTLASVNNQLIIAPHRAFFHRVQTAYTWLIPAP